MLTFLFAVSVYGADYYTEPTTGIKFVLVNGGCFKIGDTSGFGYPPEKPVKSVCVDSFYMSVFEITNKQYRVFKNHHKSGKYKGYYSMNDDNQPAVNITWDMAVSYAHWLSNKHKKVYRLPTEAEWEYAAKAGTSTRNYWGNSVNSACRYANVSDKSMLSRWPNLETHNCNDGFPVTAPVGSFKPNKYGLYDMIGNAWEWVQDSYKRDAYKEIKIRNPLNIEGSTKVLRGGSWISLPGDTRASHRQNYKASTNDDSVGFRLVIELN